MSVPPMTVASASVSPRAARPSGDGSPLATSLFGGTGARFDDALALATRTMDETDADPATTPPVAAGLEAAAAEPADASAHDPAEQATSSAGADATALAPAAMTAALAAPPASGPVAERHAIDAAPITPALQAGAIAAAGESSADLAASGPFRTVELSVGATSAAATTPPSGGPDRAPFSTVTTAEASIDPAALGMASTDSTAAPSVPARVLPGTPVTPAREPAASASPWASISASPSVPETAIEAALAPDAGRAPTASVAPPVRDATTTLPGNPVTPLVRADPVGSAATGTAVTSRPTSAVTSGPTPAVTSGPTPAEPAPTGAAAPTALAAAAPLPASVPVPPLGPAEAAAPAANQRSLVAQVSPAIVNIAQRPAGAHQITLTVSPEATGPVTVRARIGPGGDVRIDLAGATEAGRDALRAMVADLRRDLAAVMPHAHLSVGSGLTADAGAGDRGGPGGHGSLSDPSGQRRGAPSADTGSSASARQNARPLPAPSHAVTGGGLDIFV